MATLNIPRDVKDPFYRYKMERLQSKIEGKGNGIKTVVVNLSSVAQSLERPPPYVLKYFAFELGAQIQEDPAADRWIVNGAHEAAKLQDHLDGFIYKFVLCKKCKNPETEVVIKDTSIFLDCKACGERSSVDPRLKLASFVLKHQPKKGKRDKSTKKAERKARKEAQKAENNENGDKGQNSEGSGEGSNQNSDHGDENGDVELEAGSDDEFTRRINSDAKELDETKVDANEVKWTVDTSEEAVKARAKQLPDDLKRTLVVNGGDDEDKGESENNPYEQLGAWIDETAKDKGDIAKVQDVDIYVKAQELGIEKKTKTLTVLAQSVFDDNMIKQIDSRAPMLKKMITSEKHQKAFLGGTERFVGVAKPNLINSMSTILMKYYENDLITEEFIVPWGSKSSSKFVDMPTSKKVRKSAKKFIEWLETAESDDSEEE